MIRVWTLERFQGRLLSFEGDSGDERKGSLQDNILWRNIQKRR